MKIDNIQPFGSTQGVVFCHYGQWEKSAWKSCYAVRLKFATTGSMMHVIQCDWPSALTATIPNLNGVCVFKKESYKRGQSTTCGN